MKTLLMSFAALCLFASAGLAQMSHSMDHSNMHMTSKHMEGAVHTKAVVNSMGDGTANVSHEAIPEIGWPAMTMDLPVLEGAKIMENIAIGEEVTLMLVKGDDGMYAIGAIMPH